MSLSPKVMSRFACSAGSCRFSLHLWNNKLNKWRDTTFNPMVKEYRSVKGQSLANSSGSTHASVFVKV
ncbi:hypothetical protein H5410_050474, partial [Solanum commersonii]